MAVEDLTEGAHEVEGVVVIQTQDLEIGPAPTQHVEITTSHGGTTATNATQKNQKEPVVTVAALVEAGAVGVVDLEAEEGAEVIEEVVAMVEIE